MANSLKYACAVCVFAWINLLTPGVSADKRNVLPSQTDKCHVTRDVIKNALKDVCNSDILMKVSFGHIYLPCDAVLSKTITDDKPAVTLETAQNGKTYTLFMVDPDAPGHSFDQLTFWLHWAVTDIKGEVLKRRGLDLYGTVLMEYSGPSPSFGTHRYQLIVFESRPGVALQSQERSHFTFDTSELCSVAGVFEFKVPATDDM